MNGVTKEAWLNVNDPKDRDSLLYDMLSGMNSTFEGQIKACSKRFDCIEDDHTGLAKTFDRRKKVDTAAAGAGGIIGGFIAIGAAVVARLVGWLK